MEIEQIESLIKFVESVLTLDLNSPPVQIALRRVAINQRDVLITQKDIHERRPAFEKNSPEYGRVKVTPGGLDEYHKAKHELR